MNLAELVKEGDIGRIVSVEMSGVEMKWLNAPKTIMERTDCFNRLELLTNPRLVNLQLFPPTLPETTS